MLAECALISPPCCLPLPGESGKLSNVQVFLQLGRMLWLQDALRMLACLLPCCCIQMDAMRDLGVMPQSPFLTVTLQRSSSASTQNLPISLLLLQEYQTL